MSEENLLGMDFINSFPAATSQTAAEFLNTKELKSRFEQITGKNEVADEIFIEQLKEAGYQFEFIDNELIWFIK